VISLDIFEPIKLKGLIDSISSSDELKQYHCTSMLSSISLPISLNLRQLSIWLDLINKFDFIDKERAPDVPLKEVIKLIVNPQICNLTNRTWDRDQTGIMANIFFTYERDNEEMELLAKVNPDLFKQQKGRRSRKEFMTRNAFEKAFQPKMVDYEVFSKHISVPPETPSQAITLEKFTFIGPTVFIAGRYCKLSRELSQTPWILNGKRKMESSVQEIMTEIIAPQFKVPPNTMLFSSSGREDVSSVYFKH
jgi:tRNA pseudouridine synthase 10